MLPAKRLSGVEAEKKIQAIIKEGGRIILSAHCKNESMKVRDVIFDDIKNALLTGKVIKSEWSEKQHNWRYEVEGEDLANDRLNCIGVFMDEQFAILIVTVMERG